MGLNHADGLQVTGIDNRLSDYGRCRAGIPNCLILQELRMCAAAAGWIKALANVTYGLEYF